MQDLKLDQSQQELPPNGANTSSYCDANTSPIKFEVMSATPCKVIQDPLASKYLKASPSSPPKSQSQVFGVAAPSSQSGVRSRKRTFDDQNHSQYYI